MKWLLTGEIIRAVTIFVALCPCALVLATLTAIRAAIGNATKPGIAWYPDYINESCFSELRYQRNVNVIRLAMYTLHFYAATHKEDLQTVMLNAVHSGLPVFVSEYGICDVSGNGTQDVESANQWVDLSDSGEWLCEMLEKKVVQ